MDDDISSNLTSFYAFGILEEDYNLDISEFNPALLDENIKDYKKVKTTTILSKDKIFNRENRIATSINKLKTVERMNLYDQAIYRSAFAIIQALSLFMRSIQKNSNYYLIKNLMTGIY